MSEAIETIEGELPAVRRYGSLLLGSKQAADHRIEVILNNLPPSAWRQLAEDRTLLFEIFHGSCPSLATPAPQLADFAERDQPLVAALHKLSLTARSLLLLTTAGEGFSHDRMATILGLPVNDVPATLMRTRSHLAAALQNRLCVIVEDDLIAMRDLQAEITSKGFCVGGTAKNRSEAYGLADEMRPDIGIIDLALPEGAVAGADVARHLKDRFASKIIFVTAFAKIAKEIASPGDKIVRKPWSPTSLTQAMVEMAP